MKKYTFYLAMLLSVMLIACTKNPLVEGDLGQRFLIDSEKLYGKYEVLEGSIATLGISRGKLLDIVEGQLTVDCKESVEYARKYNTLTINNHSYLVSEKNEGVEYQLSYTTGNSRSVCTIMRTDKDCDEGNSDDDDDDEEGEVGGPTVGRIELDRLYGYGLGTTGGEGATTANTHHFDDGDKFRIWLAAREKAKSKIPAIVWLSGTFTKENGRAATSPWFDIKDTDNLTIYGTNSFRMQNVGFFIVRSNNIIIRNVYILMPKADNGADGISMQNSSNLWVDHCTFESMNQTSDYEDGACDVTHATTNVTISWNHFIKTQKTSLVGHSDNATNDQGIKVTYHHNFFDQTSSRHPRVRFGQVHVFNNFFHGASTYGVGSAMGAKVLVEGNYFDGVHLPTDICTYPAKRSGNSWVSNLTGNRAGFLYASTNEYVNKPSNSSDPYPFTNVAYEVYNGAKIASPLTREDFLPSYSYEIDDPEQVKDITTSGSGVGKLSGYASAPIAVDNGGIQDGGNNGDDGNDGGGNNNTIELENAWTGIAIGNSLLGANVGADKNSITIEGAGKFESGNQVFSYVYREITGDFTITVRLNDYQTTGTSNQSLAGIFLTPDVTATSADLVHAMVAKGGTGNFHRSSRTSSGSNAGKSTLTPSSGTSDPVLRLIRTGNSVSASVSLDGGSTFGTANSMSLTGLQDKAYVGLAVSSGGNDAATATFSNVTINGNVIGF